MSDIRFVQQPQHPLDERGSCRLHGDDCPQAFVGFNWTGIKAALDVDARRKDDELAAMLDGLSNWKSWL